MHELVFPFLEISALEPGIINALFSVDSRISDALAMLTSTEYLPEEHNITSSRMSDFRGGQRESFLAKQKKPAIFFRFEC